jgi:transposase
MKTIDNTIFITCETKSSIINVCRYTSKVIKDIPLNGCRVVLKLKVKRYYIDYKLDKKSYIEPLPFLDATARRTNRLDQLIKTRLVVDNAYSLSSKLKYENVVDISDKVIHYIAKGRKKYGKLSEG